jgi:integrase
MSKRNGLPPNVTEFQDRHGKWHIRFRAKGQPIRYFKSRPGTEEFRTELESFRSERRPDSVSIGSSRTSAKSISALISLYYTTPAFTGLAPSSRKTYRSTLERFRLEHGSKSIATMERRHIKAILGSMSSTPAAANKLLDKLRILMTLAVDEGWRTDNPTIGIRGFTKKTEGFHTWTEEEISAFEAHHTIGSTARLAFALMLYTGQRRSDMVRMGHQHLAADRLLVKQQKTGTSLSIPIHPDLGVLLKLVPTDRLAFVVTERGLPFSASGFGNKMRDWCDEAGLPQCSAHGLRKAAARRLAEAGCSNQQIKAITGHATDAEVSRYTAAASQRLLADQALDALGGPERERKIG